MWAPAERYMILSKVIICRHFSAAALDDGSMGKCWLCSPFSPQNPAHNRQLVFWGMDHLRFMDVVCFIHSASVSYFSNNFLSFCNLGALAWVVGQHWLPGRGDLHSGNATSCKVVPSPVLDPVLPSLPRRWGVSVQGMFSLRRGSPSSPPAGAPVHHGEFPA